MLPRALLLLVLSSAATAMMPAPAADPEGNEADNATAAATTSPAASSSTAGTAGGYAATTSGIPEAGREEEPPALAVYAVEVTQLSGETVAVEVTDAWNVGDLRAALAAKLGLAAANHVTITAAGGSRSLDNAQPAAAAAGGTVVLSPPTAIVTATEKFGRLAGTAVHRAVTTAVTSWAIRPAPGSTWEAWCGGDADDGPCRGLKVGDVTSYKGRAARCLSVIFTDYRVGGVYVKPGPLIRDWYRRTDDPHPGLPHVLPCTPVTTPLQGRTTEYPGAAEAIADLPQVGRDSCMTSIMKAAKAIIEACA